MDKAEDNLNDDTITYYSKKVFDIVFLRNPYGTSMGFIFGGVLCAFVPLLNLWVGDSTNIDLAAVPEWGWFAFGVFIFNIRSWISHEKLPEDVERIINLIEKGRKAGVSKMEIKQKYRQLIQKYMQEISLNQETQKTVNQLQELLNRKEGL